jgi:hypothetical protein
MNTLIQKRTKRLVLNNLLQAKSGPAITMAAVGGTGLGFSRAKAQDATPESPFAEPVDVVNYALTLEHIEATFYRLGLEQFSEDDFVALGFQAGVRDRVATIADHEAQHVAALTAVVTELGGEPVEEAEYDFGYTNLQEFLATGAVLEAVGVQAYTGAAQYLVGTGGYLTAALTIHGNEGRHAAYLAVVNGGNPFPDAFEPTLTPAEVLEIATPFFVM